jgi:hypothetical protein
MPSSIRARTPSILSMRLTSVSTSSLFLPYMRVSGLGREPSRCLSADPSSPLLRRTGDFVRPRRTEPSESVSKADDGPFCGMSSYSVASARKRVSCQVRCQALRRDAETHNEVRGQVKDNLERLMRRRADEDALDHPLYPRVLALPKQRGALLPRADDEQERGIQGARSVHRDLRITQHGKLLLNYPRAERHGNSPCGMSSARPAST